MWRARDGRAGAAAHGRGWSVAGLGLCLLVALAGSGEGEWAAVVVWSRHLGRARVGSGAAFSYCEGGSGLGRGPAVVFAPLPRVTEWLWQAWGCREAF